MKCASCATSGRRKRSSDTAWDMAAASSKCGRASVLTSVAFVVLSLLQARPVAPARPDTIAYTIAMPDVGSHLYSITLTVRGVTSPTVNLQMPVWSPGRYGRMDFAKNVQDFAVSGSDGQPLRWTKVDGSLWRVSTGADRSVRVVYRVFANAPMSGTFSVLDTAHANWNGASLFMYVDGHKQDPVSL